MSARRRLLIVDREPTRVGIRMALADEVEICGEADDAEHAIRTAKVEQPDLCLVGTDIPGAVSVVRGICRAAPDAAVVVLSQDEDVEQLLECVRAGAVGYVPGAVDAERLRRIVAAVSGHEAVVPRSMVRELLQEVRNAGSGSGGLSNRESQVLRLLRRGHSTSEIAQSLKIAPVTVRRHISELVHKLGVADRHELVGATKATRSHPRRRLRAGELNA